jgi:phytoene dehydrogenase-like protein
MSRVLVVGAGLGGLAVSCRLAALGHDVVLREASDTVGGKLGSYAWQTHRWDTGPSLLTLPDTLRDTFAAAGGWPPDLVLTAIRPVLRYRLRDGRWTDSDSLGPSWESLLVRGRAMWEVSRGPFLESAPTAVALARLALRDPRALVTIAPGRTLAGLGRSLPLPLQDVLWRYATYSGSDPRRAPAALASIPAIERDLGGWAVAGGLRTIVEALATRAEELGVTVRLGAPVRQLRLEGGRVTGAQDERADVVVSGVDAAHLYLDLLPRPALVRGRRSYSAFALMLALDGGPAMAEHTVLFGSSYVEEFDDLRAGRVAADPAIYVHAPSPDSWFLLINAPASDGEDRSGQVLDLLAARGLDVRGSIRHTACRTPRDVAACSGSPDGAIYGGAADGPLAGFRRPANRSPVPGLFLVGGTTHPGGGIPLVLLSAKITAGLIGAAEPSRPR